MASTAGATRHRAPRLGKAFAALDRRETTCPGRRRRRGAAGARGRALKFWDSSAVVPLLVEQEASPTVAAWLIADDVVALWTLTPVEVMSAVRRLVREQALTESDATLAEGRLADLVGAAHVVIDIEPVKSLAGRLLRLHALRAFDAL